ncbi:MAG TPA: hypothetical protein VGL42_11715 [Opitutaceae bacterium]|jgi:predicted esterase
MRSWFLAGVVLILGVAKAVAGEASPWASRRDALVERFRRLEGKEGEFGETYRPIYAAARTWYEQWGGREPHAVDSWMVPPDTYAAELAYAWEHHQNYFTQNPAAQFPLVFDAHLSGGVTMATNYWLNLPTGFGEPGRRFPLIVGLHGSGWLGHPLSMVRGNAAHPTMIRTLSVTPIDQAGPWKIEFLNAYLDELIKILPVDTDRIYVEGHSLGGIATWEWAEENPERFAAISPRAGMGETYRASRLKQVPAWPIHGEIDTVIPRIFAEQMVSALQDVGAPVRYTVLPGVPHNMPGDLDEDQVVDWYLRQTRFHGPRPADPRDTLGFGAGGVSAWSVISVPARRYFAGEPFVLHEWEDLAAAAAKLSDRLHRQGLSADALIEEVHGTGRQITPRMPAPHPLRTDIPAPGDTVIVPAGNYVRFFFRGPSADGLEAAARVAAEAATAGQPVQPGVVVEIPMTVWLDHHDSIAEYRLPVLVEPSPAR